MSIVCAFVNGLFAAKIKAKSHSFFFAFFWLGTVGASNFEPLFWLRAWNWCFRLVSMLLYEHIWFLNMLGLVDNDYRFVIKCNLRIYLWSCRHTTLKTKRAKSDEFRYYWPRLYSRLRKFRSAMAASRPFTIGLTPSFRIFPAHAQYNSFNRYISS